ncbi:MAG: three-Cys-motif partner protein TcmP [Flavihumibacter sp.]|nr:three-Cys-motif partner protein TcmP [Flavihumibacter sp.]
MNQFGGNWTKKKMDIVVSYAKAYLTIMQKQSWAKTMYFDGFAGSGTIESDNYDDIEKGTALRILDIIEPASFDLYYFVELNENYIKELQLQIQSNYFGRNAHAVAADCNNKLSSMADFLKKNSGFRALVFIDPYGMSVNWSSIESLKGLGVDLWILVPTGIGVNRLLKNDGDISDAWLQKLENFLGMKHDEIISYFYKEVTHNTLFGDETVIKKEADTVNRAGSLYKKRLETVFKYVSEPYVMRNSTNSIMYHFMMATNNTTALKIANDVIKPKYKL